MLSTRRGTESSTHPAVSNTTFLSTRRGTVTLMARADRAVSEDNVFLPFAFVEAAANLLTNSALDPYGKIPEFKFSACKVSVPEAVAAE